MMDLVYYISERTLFLEKAFMGIVQIALVLGLWQPSGDLHWECNAGLGYGIGGGPTLRYHFIANWHFSFRIAFALLVLLDYLSVS